MALTKNKGTNVAWMLSGGIFGEDLSAEVVKPAGIAESSAFSTPQKRTNSRGINPGPFKTKVRRRLNLSPDETNKIISISFLDEILKKSPLFAKCIATHFTIDKINERVIFIQPLCDYVNNLDQPKRFRDFLTDFEGLPISVFSPQEGVAVHDTRSWLMARPGIMAFLVKNKSVVRPMMDAWQVSQKTQEAQQKCCRKLLRKSKSFSAFLALVYKNPQSLTRFANTSFTLSADKRKDVANYNPQAVRKNDSFHKACEDWQDLRNEFLAYLKKNQSALLIKDIALYRGKPTREVNELEQIAKDRLEKAFMDWLFIDDARQVKYMGTMESLLLRGEEADYTDANIVESMSLLQSLGKLMRSAQSMPPALQFLKEEQQEIRFLSKLGYDVKAREEVAKSLVRQDRLDAFLKQARSDVYDLECKPILNQLVKHAPQLKALKKAIASLDVSAVSIGAMRQPQLQLFVKFCDALLLSRNEGFAKAFNQLLEHAQINALAKLIQASKDISLLKLSKVKRISFLTFLKKSLLPLLKLMDDDQFNIDHLIERIPQKKTINKPDVEEKKQHVVATPNMKDRQQISEEKRRADIQASASDSKAETRQLTIDTLLRRIERDQEGVKLLISPTASKVDFLLEKVQQMYCQCQIDRQQFMGYLTEINQLVDGTALEEKNGVNKAIHKHFSAIINSKKWDPTSRSCFAKLAPTGIRSMRSTGEASDYQQIATDRLNSTCGSIARASCTRDLYTLLQSFDNTISDEMIQWAAKSFARKYKFQTQGNVVGQQAMQKNVLTSAG